MNETQGSKQQIVEKIKSSANILVTVSKDPSVDELSAALGLTSMLNGMNKHATAVVSGALPPAIDFLEPGKTFENTVDSLRDFIIALDKEKADHLRYKVDGDVVKIFITPYRTTIDENDLDFSQGDYNVELVLALGVKDKDNLDAALEAHGRILHDATVATLSCSDASNLGSIDWTDTSASSISEMLVALSEALKSDKPLLSEQVATAFLTGIVASTDRFSNNKTSSKVMTMAAQLMAAGANQQLIATRLEEAHEIGNAPTEEVPTTATNNDGSTNLNEGESTKVDRSAKKSAKKKEKAPKDDGTLAISHEKAGDIDEVAKQTASESQDEAAAAAEASVAAATASSSDDELAKELSSVAPQASAKPSVSDLQKDIAAASADVAAAADQPTQSEAVLPSVETGSDEPTMGGTLNATAEQAAADKLAEENSTKNKTILSHSSGSYVGNQDPVYDAPLNATMKKQTEEPKSVDIFGGNDQPYIATPISSPAPVAPVSTPESAPVVDTPAPQTLADLDQQNRGKSDEHNAAQAAVADAYNSAPFDPSNQPQQNVGAQPLGDSLHSTEAPATPAPSDGLPPLPSFTPPPPPPLPEMPAAAPAPALAPTPQPQAGPVSSEQLGNIFGDTPAPQEPAAAPTANDPNQFKIPGQ